MRQTFSKGQHVWVKSPYGTWRIAIVAEPDVQQKSYAHASGHFTHHVRILWLVNGQPTGEGRNVRNNRAEIVTEKRFAELSAEKQAKEWYDTVARQQQREDELARFTDKAITIVETCGGDVAKLTDYLMTEFNLPRWGHSTPEEIVERRAENRKEAEEAKNEIVAAGLPPWKPWGAKPDGENVANDGR